MLYAGLHAENVAGEGKLSFFSNYVLQAHNKLKGSGGVLLQEILEIVTI